jgi:prepilin-type N-terminal cleavage/methylation domain-containing protein/prepilin-type processing-associated H-X9-DG protein
MSSRAKVHRGFTLIELLIVIAIIAVLATLLLPTLARAKALGTRTVCVSNFKQLQLAWLTYIDDNRGQLVLNAFSWSPNPQSPDNIPSWVQGIMYWDEEENTGKTINNTLEKMSSTNTTFLVGSRALFTPYIPTYRIYKCPADKSQVTIGQKKYDRVRSYCMNEYLGDPSRGRGEFAWANPPYYPSVADVDHLDRSQLTVMIEVHEDTIYSPVFPCPGHSWSHEGLPASRHNGTCATSFSDGHVEVRKWLDASTKRPVTGKHPAMNILGTGDRDTAWVRDRMLPPQEF